MAHAYVMILALWLAGSLMAQDLTSPLVQTPADAESYFSADKRFQLVLEEPTENENPLPAISTGDDAVEDFTVAMYAMEKGGGRLLWRSRCKGPYPLFLSDVIVSPEGDFFVTLPRTSTNAFVRTKTAARAFTIESRLIKTSPEEWSDTITALEKEPDGAVLRIWNAHQDRWTAFKMPSGTALTGSVELTNRWNETTRKKILDLFAAEQSDLLRRKIESISPAVERISAKLGGEQRAETPQNVHAAFLAARRHPDDRTLFERMIKRTDARRTFLLRLKVYDWKDRRTFVEPDTRRLQADRFLAVWDGKGAETGKHYLGGAKGTVQLPAPILRNPGAVEIYLIPEGAERGRWIERVETERLECRLWEPVSTDPDLANEIFFAFETVTPGNYFVKVIWDRRRPYAYDDKGQQSAGPGDYESELTGPITISAGQVVSNLVLTCSIRASEGSAYYAADKLAYEKWKSGNLTPAMANPGGVR